ncbi:transposase [Candidatus Gottesmanbacteria bacterium]|nr:transposase [Candidatus Gottesmanbacteria bacterium]MBI5452201.1 transposase [Candidatus Gottesmanbacteria bacterium]
MRNLVFAADQIYHVFNRGIEKRPTFLDKREYERALLTVDFYQYEDPPLRLAKALQLNKKEREEFFINLKKQGMKLATVICFCFMPNHFHFLLKQKKEGGITKFLSNFANSYTRYFNTKHKRVGPLFQGTFKAVRIEDEEQLLHVSRYIHLNPVTSYLIKEEDLNSYQWSSFPEYLRHVKDNICDKDMVLAHFKSADTYRRFVYDQSDYSKRLAQIKHLIFD